MQDTVQVNTTGYHWTKEDNPRGGYLNVLAPNPNGEMQTKNLARPTYTAFAKLRADSDSILKYVSRYGPLGLSTFIYLDTETVSAFPSPAKVAKDEYQEYLSEIQDFRCAYELWKDVAQYTEDPESKSALTRIRSVLSPGNDGKVVYHNLHTDFVRDVGEKRQEFSFVNSSVLFNHVWAAHRALLYWLNSKIHVYARLEWNEKGFDLDYSPHNLRGWLWLRLASEMRGARSVVPPICKHCRQPILDAVRSHRALHQQCRKPYHRAQKKVRDTAARMHSEGIPLPPALQLMALQYIEEKHRGEASEE